jgi:hypothetical protein
MRRAQPAQLELDLAQSRRQPVALVAQRPCERDHGLEEPALPLLDAARGGRKDLDR